MAAPYIGLDILVCPERSITSPGSQFMTYRGGEWHIPPLVLPPPKHPTRSLSAPVQPSPAMPHRKIFTEKICSPSSLPLNLGHDLLHSLQLGFYQTCPANCRSGKSAPRFEDLPRSTLTTTSCVPRISQEIKHPPAPVVFDPYPGTLTLRISDLRQCCVPSIAIKEPFGGNIWQWLGPRLTYSRMSGYSIAEANSL